MPIQFFNEDISFELENQTQITRWLIDIIANEGYHLIELNYIFCSDSYLHSINISYLNHDTFTDIITFDNSEEPNTIESDIFISIDRVRENATLFDVSFDHELRRVIVHGLLHLVGYQDKSSEEITLMRKKEEACLSLLTEMK